MKHTAKVFKIESQTNKSHSFKTKVSWQDQVVTVLPLVLFVVTLIQLVAIYKYFDISIYNNQSVELVGGSINTIWEKLFVFDSVAVVLVNIIGLIGFITERRWSFSVILFAGFLSLCNAVVMLNIISVLAGLLWIILLLHIRKQFV